MKRRRVYIVRRLLSDFAGEAGVESLKPAPNNFLQKWPVSKRVNSSRANDDDATLVNKVELATAQ
jgi:hypothetical protein